MPYLMIYLMLPTPAPVERQTPVKTLPGRRQEEHTLANCQPPACYQYALPLNRQNDRQADTTENITFAAASVGSKKS